MGPKVTHMQSIHAMPYGSMGETTNFLIMSRELRLPDHLVNGRLESEYASRETYMYALQLSEAM